jgi:dTDP-4-amino-4,6-dideoxygalactose transaminase
MPVHLYGSSANLTGIKKLIINKNIKIIDDCAQAHGAYDDSIKLKKRIGSTSYASCFSFYPGKNLGAYGDAGIITTNNSKFYNILKKIRNLGSNKKYVHDYIGMNSRLDTIQASILVKKLSMLNIINKKRRKIAEFYKKNINNKKIKKLVYSKSCVYHQYIILVKDRSKLTRTLSKNYIPYGFHYPYPINKLHALKKMFKNEKYPNAEKLGKECVSLPMDPNLNIANLKKITRVLNSF